MVVSEIKIDTTELDEWLKEALAAVHAAFEREGLVEPGETCADALRRLKAENEALRRQIGA